MTRRITFLHYQGIGDNILAFPLVRALRRLLPDAWLQVMVPSKRHGLYHATGVDRLFSYAESGDCLQDPEEVVFDLDTGSGDRAYRELIRRLRCRTLIGFDTSRPAQPAAGRVLRAKISQKPMWRQYLDLCEILTGEPVADPEPPVLDRTPAAEQEISALFAGLGEARLLAVAPGAAVAEKRWPASSFAAVVRHACERFGAVPVLLGSEDERQLAGEILDAAAGQALDLFGCSLELAAAALARARLTLANDSAMLHISAALGVPVLGLYGRYCSPQTHRPMGRRFTLLYTPGNTPDRIQIDEVLPHVERYLASGDPVAEHWRRTRRVVVLEAA